MPRPGAVPRRLLPLLPAALLAGAARAEDVLEVLESRPAADAILAPEDRRVFVRFNRPVDHQRSRLLVVQGHRLVALLDPSLEAEPEVLFAHMPELPPGRYAFRWLVISLDGTLVAEGGAPFTIMG